MQNLIKGEIFPVSGVGGERGIRVGVVEKEREGETKEGVERERRKGKDRGRFANSNHQAQR